MEELKVDTIVGEVKKNVITIDKEIKDCDSDN